MNIWKFIEANPAVQEAVAVAKQVAAADLEVAREQAHQLIAHSVVGLSNDLPALEQKGLDTLYHFIPDTARGAVQGFAGAIVTQTLQAVNPEVQSVLASALGLAITRIDATITHAETSLGAAPAPAAAEPAAPVAAAPPAATEGAQTGV